MSRALTIALTFSRQALPRNSSRALSKISYVTHHASLMLRAATKCGEEARAARPSPTAQSAVWKCRSTIKRSKSTRHRERHGSMKYGSTGWVAVLGPAGHAMCGGSNVDFQGETLKNRNIRRPHELEANLRKLVTEALFTRRLSEPTNDSNRWRWPMHPIWSEAYRSCGAAAMLPVGRKVTGRRVALVDRAEKQIRGAIRSATVLAFGDYDDAKARALAQRAHAGVMLDRRHNEKVRVATDRYSNVDKAK